MDDLLSATYQVQLSECNPTQLTEQTDIAKSVTFQTMTTYYSDSTASDSTYALGQLSKSDSTHVSVGTQYSLITTPYDRVTSLSGGTSSRGLIQHEGNGHSHDASTSGGVSRSEPVHKTLIHFHDKIVTAFSTDILSISEELVANEFVPVELSEKMINPSSTSKEKAIILLNAVINKIKIAPKQFPKLMKVFSGHTCTKEVVEQMSSHASQENDDAQDKMKVVFPGQNYAISEGHMNTGLMDLSSEPMDQKMRAETY